MENANFLKDIARYWIKRREQEPRLASLVFVTPNKRSAMFLKKYIRDGISGVAFMPRFMTLRTFLSINSPMPEVPEREALFILYQAYLDAMHEQGRQERLREFDSFIFWGDIILNDFNDIDRSLVNAEDLFRNLKNLKEIQADYLDEEQKEVVRRIWGDSLLTQEIDRFWMHVDESEESLGAQFLYLWEILGNVYKKFNESLRNRGFCSVGSLYRNALNHFKNLAPYEVSGDTHYVFVGFNDLSVSETLIFQRLKDLGCASFFWDTVPLRLCGDEGPVSRPMKRLAQLAHTFPMPDDFTLNEPEGFPRVSVTSVPSGVAQVKFLGTQLEKWLESDCIDGKDGINTAVVIPDPSLLMPVLFSIPEEIEKINISIGLPYRSTTFASLLHSVVAMQLKARKIHNKIHYFYQDVVAVLSHPHIRILAADSASALNDIISSEKIYNIPAELIQERVPALKAVFAPVNGLDSVRDVAEYLINLFDWLGNLMTEKNPENTGSFEIKAIAYFRDEVIALRDIIERYGVTMSERTFLHLFERVFNARGLTVNGAPLQGLQILGVLETRALDFDNVAITSMNEKIFPKRQYGKTMIPNTLRHGFGLPDFDSLEWTYAYSFFRLIARAKNVALFYDSRTDATGDGELSRYISQLRYLMPGIDVDTRTATLEAIPSEKSVLSVEKTPDVMRHLDRFRSGGSLRLSASALKTFKSCPLRFYLAYVRCMRGNDELVDYMTAADYGTIVHNVIQALYEPYKEQPITAEIIREILDSDVIERTSRQKIIENSYPEYAGKGEVELPTEGELSFDIISAIARANMKAELKTYGPLPFRYKEAEDRYDISWPIDEDLAVRFYMSVDRVDILPGGKLRFIDFKTGKEKTSGAIDKLFDSDEQEYNGMFQLLTYCEAYKAGVDPEADIIPMIHPMRTLISDENILPLKVDKTEVTSFRDVSEIFLPLLKNLIKSIFDPKVPFTQCEKTGNCKYCPFQNLCGRIVTD